MSLWQRAGVSCSTASEHKCSWHKWRKFFSVWLCLLDGCYSVLTGNNAIQKFKGRWGSWASAQAADYISNSNSNYESKNITLPQVKTTLNNDRKIPWVHSYRRSYQVKREHSQSNLYWLFSLEIIKGWKESWNIKLFKTLRWIPSKTDSRDDEKWAETAGVDMQRRSAAQVLGWLQKTIFQITISLMDYWE